MFKCLPILKGCQRYVEIIERRHAGLVAVPDEAYRSARTLEELILDANQIKDLPAVRILTPPFFLVPSPDPIRFDSISAPPEREQRERERNEGDATVISNAHFRAMKYETKRETSTCRAVPCSAVGVF